MDVTAGAIVLLAFFGQELNVEVEWREMVGLALAVFMIYNLDHLNDSLFTVISKNERRRFHFTYSKPIALICACTSVVGLWIYGLRCWRSDL